jgi:phage-related protein
MKPVVWLGTSKADLKAFPATAMGDPSGAFRTIYLATRPEAIYVLHCFRKKTPKTARQDIDLARQRLARVPRRAPHG